MIIKPANYSQHVTKTNLVPKQICDQIVRVKNDFNSIIMPAFKVWEEFINLSIQKIAFK